ncbi:aldo/keto reductase [Variovorax sp. J22R133]|uniref:aldo/keto reductase n=1 Tax=Variovorax brevis TaxID=3053503 RepID=UPI0025774A0A|nr:aldo/keto reductase [Variovorax sp. J22R133]MDM0110614.1 aldo/keto reductase [Variovorax sp. J22R133]
MTRARLLRMALGACVRGALPLSLARPVAAATSTMHTRPIPATNEAMPVIGCGTWMGFDRSPGTPEYAGLAGVLDALFAAGGRMIDSSPMYGRSETTTGDLLAAAKTHPKAFLATKVWTNGRDAGIAQMEQSFARLKTTKMDLMQVHNLVDWRTQLATIRAWKAQGRVRYVGVTHYTSSAYGDVEAVLRAEKLDFLQINYSLDQREAEQRLLPLAAERGVAAIVNMPFGGGGLLRKLRGKPLPDWAAQIDCTSWAQVLLKFVLTHPAVTCTIPGTGRAEHMADNAKAGMGAMPDAAFWQQHGASVLG